MLTGSLYALNFKGDQSLLTLHFTNGLQLDYIIYIYSCIFIMLIESEIVAKEQYMKTAKFELPVIIAFLLFLTSCQKQLDFENSSNNIITTADSIYLDKIYELDIAGNKIDSVVFVYDNQKRVTSMGFNYTLPDDYMYTYYYNGSDTLPFKSRYIRSDATSSDTTITYHTYNAGQRNLKDSAIVSRLSTGPFGSYTLLHEVVHYSYTTGKKYAYTDITYFFPPAGSLVREDTAVVDAGNNVVSSKANFSTTTLQNSSSLTYDTHVNPFSLLSNFKAHQRFPSGETLFFEYFPFNNILSLTEVNQGASPITTKYTYTYKTNGLPATAIIIFNITDITRLQYTYKKL